jgi:DNA-binding MarR family transcriptional regulator
MPRRPSPPRPHGIADRFVLTDVVSHLLRRAHFRAEALFVERLGRWGITPRQKALLVTVYQHPGETQHQLAARIALDRVSFAEMLRRMVARGLVRRVRAERDRRAWAVRLTPKGERLLKDVLPHDLEVEARVIAPVPRRYRATFVRCLKLMLALETADGGRGGRERRVRRPRPRPAGPAGSRGRGHVP